MWVFPIAAAAVSGAFAAVLGRNFLQRRRLDLGAWSLALAMFSIASFAAGVAMLFEWTTAWFRVYYYFGAIVNVLFLALGTIYLLAPRPVAHACGVAVLVAAGFAIPVTLGADLQAGALAVEGIPSAREVVPAAADELRLLSRFYSYAGFTVVVGGALWSALRLARRREESFRRLARANLAIASGTTVVAVASAFARFGRGSVFAMGLAFGVAIMFAGFLATRQPFGNPSVLKEGWYLMSTEDLERELTRLKGSLAAPSNALPLSIEDALIYRNAGNKPDDLGRTLRLVLLVGDFRELQRLHEKRLQYEPDFHEAPQWRVEGSRPVNVVPVRVGESEVEAPETWLDDPELAALEDEWTKTGAVAGIRVPAELRGFVYKTVLALQAAGHDVTAASIADSVARWVPASDAQRIREELFTANRPSPTG